MIVVQLHNELGLIASQCGDYQLSTKLLEQALFYHQQLDEEECDPAVIKQNLGAALNAVGRYTEAIKHSESAASLYG